MIDTKDNNAASIILAARTLGQSETQRPERTTIGALEVLFDRTGNVTSLERFADNPRRKRATVSLHETLSFIHYVNAHKLSGPTHLFGKATEIGGSFTAVLDYHGGGIISNQPNWGDHVAKLTLEPTPEWVKWVKNNGTLMPQEAFSEFIEDQLDDIITPAAAEILEMAQGLQGRKNATFKGGKNLKDGAITFEYIETVEIQGVANRRDDTFRVPDKLSIRLQPFVGSATVYVDARLRFRIGNDGKLSFAYILNRPHKIVEEAFQISRDRIEAETDLQVHLGSAEIRSA